MGLGKNLHRVIRVHWYRQEKMGNLPGNSEKNSRHRINLVFRIPLWSLERGWTAIPLNRCMGSMPGCCNCHSPNYSVPRRYCFLAVWSFGFYFQMNKLFLRDKYRQHFERPRTDNFSIFGGRLFDILALRWALIQGRVLIRGNTLYFV